MLYPAALIVRTSLIYDFDPANAQPAWMIRAIERGDPVTLYTDQYRCPTWVHTLADALLELAEMDNSGLLHVAGPDLISRYDLGVALLDALGYPRGSVRPVLMPEGQAILTSEHTTRAGCSYTTRPAHGGRGEAAHS
jgi:dTDP-4-dehydrorhamnose reductase